jgi:hypothetical protein
MTETAKPLTEQSPSAIDEQLYELYTKAAIAKSRVASAEQGIHYVVDRKHGYGRTARWGMTLDEAFRACTNLVETQGFRWTTAQSALAELDSTRATMYAAQAVMVPFNDEFNRRGGWTRAFLVTNGNGHVHSSMSCSTCNRGQSATDFAWMTEYSGMDEAAIVDAAGWRACTVCYPSAPVGDENQLPTRMFSEQDKSKAQAKAERDAAKAARDAKRIEKALTADGSEFEVPDGHGYTERFKTEQAASQWAVAAIANHRAYGYSIAQGSVDMIVAAIAAKHGTSEDEVKAEMERKVAAKIKRDSRG